MSLPTATGSPGLKRHLCARICRATEGTPVWTGRKDTQVLAAAGQNLYSPWGHFLSSHMLDWGCGDGVPDRDRPVQVEVLSTQEGVRRTIRLPGEAGPAVEGETAFFSRDLPSVLKGNRLNPQVLIQGRLSCKTARAIGTIIIRYLLCEYYLTEPAASEGGMAQPQVQARNRDPGRLSSARGDSNRHQSTEPIGSGDFPSSSLLHLSGERGSRGGGRAALSAPGQPRGPRGAFLLPKGTASPLMSPS